MTQSRVRAGALWLFVSGACAVVMALAVSPQTGRAQSGGDGPAIYLPLSLASFDLADRPRATAVVVTRTPTPTLPPTQPPTATNTPPPTAVPTPEGYWEPLTSFPSLEDLQTGYRASGWYDTMMEVLERRYPTGAHIVSRVEASQSRAKYWAGSSTGSWDELMDVLQHVVHEMNHELGIQEGVEKTQYVTYVYVVREDLQVEVAYEKDYFPRSEIASYVTGPLANMYKSNYLSGSLGRMGFQNTLDEVNAYTHSLFTGYGVHDQFPTGQRASYRDGVVTFLMYTEFYLRQARVKHPDQWAAMHDDPAMRDLVKLLWDRANFILDVSKDEPGLALDAAAVEAEIHKADMEAEIEQFVSP